MAPETAAPPAAALDPIARTAWYCCGARALDAASAKPICGDHLAERFMTDKARVLFKRFERFTQPNRTNAARHRLIDDLLRERLQAAPDRLVVLLGAGFDTRAFRLQGGRWVELDQPALMALKEQKLPQASAPNPLQRVPIDFARDTLAQKLAPWSGARDALVVMEGVSMYLSPQQWQQTAQTLQQLLPGHELICDLVSAAFVRRYSGPLRREIQALGGDFAVPMADPVAGVEALGYQRRDVFSVVERAVDYGALKMPRWLLNTLLRSLRDGYRIGVFDALHVRA